MSPLIPNHKRLFDIEVQGDTLLLIPLGSLREGDYEQIEMSRKEILAYLDSTSLKNIVVDLGRMDYSSSTALGLFVRLSKVAHSRSGRVAFCNVSDHEKEVLRATHLDRVWSIYPSRQDALDAIRG